MQRLVFVFTIITTLLFVFRESTEAMSPNCTKLALSDGVISVLLYGYKK
jgi:hypothetical protein